MEGGQSKPPPGLRAGREARAQERFAAKAAGPGARAAAPGAPAAGLDDGGQGVVRIKPMGAGGGGGETSAAADARPMQFSTDPPAVLAGAHEFRYPRHVIGPERDQQSLFDEFMPARIDGFLDGNNVNVMAYGQTGSGKTHTVFGPPGIMAKAGAGELGLGVCADYGIFPRGLWAIYERVTAMNGGGGGTSYFLTASCVELSLMGNLDMLVKSHDERNAERDKSWAESRANAGSGPQLDKFSTPPRMYGMVELPMETPDDLLRIFAAIASRNTAGTLMNDSSSRSHCICWLTLFAHDKASDAVRRSRFQFVDLAGSERVKEASGGSENLWAGGTATEGLMTNWSLMMLSKAARDIVASGGKKKGRKQKLAHTAGYIGDLVPLLADSLTGDALTALFVCVSQAPDNVMQSKIALEFGEVFSKLTVSCHDIIAAIWVAFFSRWQRYRC